MLELPLEIRRQIYTYLTGLSRVDHLNFLCACKKLHDEAQVSYLSRPLCFSDQEELTQFSSQPYRSQAYVQDLSLVLTDLDRDVMRPFLAQVVMDMSKRTFQYPYELEATRTTYALQSLPNIARLSLLEPTRSGVTPAPRLLLNNVLNWIAQQYVGLRRLRIDSSNVSLEPIASLHNLRSLRITGFSETPPSRATTILRGLPKLAELHIVCRRRQSRYFACQTPRKSVGSETLRYLRPLRVIRINDFAELSNRQAAFLDVNMLKSIGESHSSSLRQFGVSSLSPLDPGILSQLAETIYMTSGLHSLSLSWPNIGIELLDSLPPAIWSLQILVSGQPHATKMLKALVAMSERILSLRKIHFLVPGSLAQAQVSSMMSSSSQNAYFWYGLEVPWTVTWGVWQPFPDE